MFVVKTDGVYPLDPNEPAPATWELERAEEFLRIWERSRKRKTKATCPHEDLPCRVRRECLGKIVWWRRYIREIELWLPKEAE